MKKLLVLVYLAAALSLTTGTAMADSIKGRVGVTGKIGLLLPGNSDYNELRVKPDAGFVGGGGVLYGIDDNFAVEADITRSEFGTEFPNAGNAGDFGFTDLSLGCQFRFEVAHNKLVPYVGVGLDILMSDYDDQFGIKHDIDTTVGAHVSGGIDYFILKQLALTAEIKAIAAPETDIKDNLGVHRGNFDPSSISGTAGVRFFFN